LPPKLKWVKGGHAAEDVAATAPRAVTKRKAPQP
jgi:hypothetical protein